MTSLTSHASLNGRKVLLLGDSRMAFPIAKALAKAGVQVYSGVSTSSNYLEWSRFLAGSFRHPSTDPGTDEALPYFLEWLANNPDVDAIQPVSESTSRMLLRHRAQFERFGALIMPAPETIAACHDKAAMFRLCEELRLPLAPYQRIQSKSDLLDAARSIGFPLIVKPSTVDAELFDRKAIIASSMDELTTAFFEWPVEHPELIVQKFVSGPRHSVIFSAQNGRLLKATQVAALRTHEDDGTGYTTYGITVAPHPALRSATEKLVEHLNYSSTGCLQFIIDPQTDEVTFMELNPRTSLARISEAAGVNHSVLGLQQALGMDTAAIGDPWDTKIGVRYAWTKGDLMRIKRGVKSGRMSFGHAARDLFTIGGDALRSQHAIFDPLDPMPAIGTYWHFLIKHLWQRNYTDRPSRDFVTE